ncbi:MAG: hypothetical protein ACUVXB_11665 [Bryobacteraceae bacterium]
MRLLFVGLAAFLLLTAPAADGESLRGAVLEDHTGRPVMFAGIRIYEAGRRPALPEPLLADVYGRFQTPELPPGDYEVEAYHQDYLPTVIRTRVPGPEVSLRMAKRGTIWGRVLDLEGRPESGARIAVLYKPAQGLVLQPFGPPIAVNRDGQFRASGLPPGEYAVAVLNAASGGAGLYYYPRNERPQFFAISGGEQYSGVEFRLPRVPRFRLSGTMDLPPENGRPVAVLYWAEQPVLPVASSRIAPGGEFLFDQIPPGDYLLAAIRPTYGFGAQGGMLSPEDILGMTRLKVERDQEQVRIPPLVRRRVTLSLVSSTTEPPAGCPTVALVTLAPLQPPGAGERVEAELAYGRPASLSAVLPGRYRPVATLGEGCYLNSPAFIEVGEASQEVAFAFELAPAGSVRGRIRGGDAAPPIRYLVSLLPSPEAPGSSPARVAWADSVGRYSFEGLRPGYYRLALRPVDSNGRTRWFPPLSQTREIAVLAGSALEVDLELPPPRYR